MTDAKIPRKNKDIVCRDIGGETVLVPIYRNSRELNSIYTLNASAAWVWDKIDGKRSWQAIELLLKKDFDTTDKQAEAKLDSLRKELTEIKAVI